jgi:hypothetical protein
VHLGGDGWEDAGPIRGVAHNVSFGVWLEKGWMGSAGAWFCAHEVS